MFKLGALADPGRFTLPSRRTRIAVAMILAILVECFVVSVAVDMLVGYRAWQAHLVDSILAVAVVAQLLFMTGGLIKHEEDRIDTYVEV